MSNFLFQIIFNNLLTLVLFQTCMNLFLLLNTKNLYIFFKNTMEVDPSTVWLPTFVLCSPLVLHGRSSGSWRSSQCSLQRPLMVKRITTRLL